MSLNHSRHPVSAAILSFAIFLVAGCSAGETIHGNSALPEGQTAPLRATSGDFEVVVLPDSTGSFAGGLALATADKDGTTSLELTGTDVSGCSRLYLAISYDAEHLRPVRARPSDLFAANDDCLELLVDVEPGVLQYGLVLPGAAPRAISGSGGLVHVEFVRADSPQQLAAHDPLQTRRPSAGPAAIGDMSRNARWNLLQWSYLNPGDYDQNGVVNISDMTPLGLHFGKTGPFGSNSALWMVDGDGNGEINLGDLTVIGMNFGNEVTGYQLYASPDGAGYPATTGARLVAELPLAQALGSAADRRYFRHEDLEPLYLDRYWVVPQGGGAASNLTAEWNAQWHIEELFSKSVSGGWGTSGLEFSVVNDWPCVAWASGDADFPLYFLRATDAVGSAWPVPLIVPTGSPQNGVTQIMDIGGRPALAARIDSATWLLKAGDEEGTEWNTKELIANDYRRIHDTFEFEGRLRLLMSWNNVLLMTSGDSLDPSAFSPEVILDEIFSASGLKIDDQLGLLLLHKSTQNVYFNMYGFTGDQIDLLYQRTLDGGMNSSRAHHLMQFGDKLVAWYSSEGYTKLYQVSSTDTTGMTWLAPQQIDLGVGEYGQVDVLQVYGKLFMVLADIDATGFRILINDDLSIAGWTDIGGFYQEVTYPTKTGMQIVRGHPAMVIHDDAGSVLKYSYARYY